MTDRGSIEGAIRALHAARVAGELEALCQLFDPGALFRVSGSSAHSPVAIAARGTQEIRLWLSVLVRTFRLTDYELLGLLVDGEAGAAHWRARIHSKVTGVAVPTELIDWVQLRGGRIVAYTEFFSPC
jgi:ketosteroid isomerase-like protein